MNKSNKSRTLVNIIGLPLVVSSILLGGYYFISFIYIVIFLGTKEYLDLLKKHSIEPSSILLYLAQFSLLICNSIFAVVDWFNISIFLVIITMIMEIFKKSSTPLFNISSILFGYIWIGVFLHFLIYVRSETSGILMLAIFLSLWMCDTCAFFFGKHFGKTKIIPDISPNKTVLGSISGLFGSILFLSILSLMNVIQLTLLQSLILALITGGISQFGDFFESSLKRELDIKDTSNILRGHGGVLDRFDSLFIIAPLLIFYLNFVIK